MCTLQQKIVMKELEIKAAQEQLDRLKKQQKEEQLINVSDIIVYHSGTRLQLLAAYHKNGKTLILVNRDTGTIYRQKFNHSDSPSLHANDLVVPFGELVWPVFKILDWFGIKKSKFSHIEGAR